MAGVDNLPGTTVEGVFNSAPKACWLFLLEEESLVGGGVCICDVSIVLSLVALDAEKALRRAPEAIVLTARESGDDDNLRDGSTGGNGRWTFGVKWLT